MTALMMLTVRLSQCATRRLARKPNLLDVPLVCVRKAIEEDHPERELVQVEQHLAAGHLVEILKTSDQDEIAQKIEEPLREIAH